MVSVIIPVYKEPYLDKTIASIHENAVGEIEVIAVSDDGRGMRGTINEGLRQAKGDYIIKVDAHCIFAKGFDQELLKGFQDNWLVVPRRYVLDENSWQIKRHVIHYDYHYLAFPYERSKWGSTLIPLGYQKDGPEIDDTMSFQGSFWMAKRSFFDKIVGKLDDVNYSGFGGEQLEVGLKYWLNGGEVKVNKNTWYAHMGKRRAFHLRIFRSNYNLKRKRETLRSTEIITKSFINNEIPGLSRSFEWLVEKFWPIPNWPDNWKEELTKVKYTYL